MHKPRDYLEEYYGTPLDAGSIALMEFYAEVYADLAGRPMLEFGGGPAIHSLISAARTSGDIHFVDASDAALGEVRSWLRGDPEAFDWRAFFACALACEPERRGGPTPVEIDERMRLVRRKITAVGRCDAFAPDMLLGEGRPSYGVVATNFCLEGITDAKQVWRDLNKRLVAMLDDGGLFVTAIVLNANYWSIGQERFPSVRLDLTDVIGLYAGLGLVVTHERAIELYGRLGYDGIGMVAGRKPLGGLA